LVMRILLWSRVPREKRGLSIVAQPKANCRDSTPALSRQAQPGRQRTAPREHRGVRLSIPAGTFRASARIDSPFKGRRRT
jgi:hypothetical protein